MAFVLRATQNVDIAVDEITDKKGNPATIQDPTWASSDESIVTVVGSGLTATASAVGPLGTATVTLTGDADLGEGVKPITGTLDVEIVAGDAAVFNLVPGTPSEQ